MAITDQKCLVGGCGVHHAALYEVHQIVDGNQAAQVVYAAQRQWYATPYDGLQPGKVARCVGAVHQRRANHHHFHPTVRSQRQQTAFGVELGLSIGTVRGGGICFLVGVVLATAVDANGAQKHHAPHAGCHCLLSQPQRAFGIGAAVQRQRIGGGVVQHMHPGGGMYHHIDALQQARPISVAVDGADGVSRSAGVGSQSVGAAAHQPQLPWVEGLLERTGKVSADKSGSSGNQASFHEIFPRPGKKIAIQRHESINSI